jgi:hypothetical protein
MELAVATAVLLLPVFIFLATPTTFGPMFEPEVVSIAGIPADLLILGVGVLGMVFGYAAMWWLLLHDHEAHESPWLSHWGT